MEFKISQKFIDKSKFMKIDEVNWSKVQPGTAFGINTRCDIIDEKVSVCYSYIFIKYTKLLNEIEFYHTKTGSIDRIKLINANRVFNFIIDDFREDDLIKIPTINLDNNKFVSKCVVFKDVILHNKSITDDSFFMASNYNSVKNTCDLTNLNSKFKLSNVNVSFLTSATNIFIKDNYNTEPKVTDVDCRFKLIIRTDESRDNKIVIVKRNNYEFVMQIFPKLLCKPNSIEKFIRSSLVYILTNNEKYSYERWIDDGEKYYHIDYDTFEIKKVTFRLDNPECLYDRYFNNIFQIKENIDAADIEKIKTMIKFNDKFFNMKLMKRKEEENNGIRNL